MSVRASKINDPREPATLAPMYAILIAAAIFWIFWPALRGDWLWDDDIYITHNPVMNDTAGLWKIWFQPGSVDNYFPITFTAHWIEWHLWHNATLGYHLTNVVLHLASALLVWFLLDKLGLRLAWLGGLIFAVHPVQVESVAWIAELKNVLSLPPFLLAMCAWIDFDEHRRARDFALSLGFFIVAMLCKTTMIMFPFVLLGYAWWKRGRVTWTDLKAAAPFFAVSLALGLLTIVTEQRFMGANTVPLGDALSRVACAGLAYAFYLSKCVWPAGLLPTYPRWEIDPPTVVQFLPWPVLLGLLALLWWKRETWGRTALFGLGFFLVMLLPFVGFLSSGFMSFTWVMDHFLYLPIVGLIAVAVAGIEAAARRIPERFRVALTALVTIALVLMAFISHSYAAAFSDEETLWTYAVAHNPDTWLAQADLGRARLANGRVAEAIAPLEAAQRLKPTLPGVALNLGTIYLQLGRYPEAVQQLETAQEIDPADADVRNQEGIALAKLGRIPEALAQFAEAVRLQPDFVLARIDWGIALARGGHLDEALAQFQAAVQIDPRNGAAHFNLAKAYVATNRPADALREFRLLLARDPNNAAIQAEIARLEKR